jgi:uncharacterized protein (TIGR00270 family)
VRESLPAFSRPRAAPRKAASILDVGDEIAAGYGATIRAARERKGLTIEELGKMVFEKASFLHRIEAETAKPDRGLAKKLENALGVKITKARVD